MLFQKKMRLPIDNELLPSDEEEIDSEENLTEVIERLFHSRREAFQAASCSIANAQTRAVFPVGSEVLLENTAQKQRKGGIMDPLWLGPYVISRDLGKRLYELSNLNKKVIKSKANVNQSKKYVKQLPEDGKKIFRS